MIPSIQYLGWKISCFILEWKITLIVFEIIIAFGFTLFTILNFLDRLVLVCCYSVHDMR